MPSHPSRSPSPALVVLQYTPRADAASRGYEDWLRAVDNPFFNSVPGIVRYENWRVHAPLLGTPDYTHFDLMYVEDEAAVERVWSNPVVAEFAANWTRQWGRVSDPTVNQAVNYHVTVCREIAGPIVPRRTNWCLFLPYVPRADAAQRGYDEYLREVDNPFFNSAAVPEVISDANWRKVTDVIGQEWWTDFDLMFIEGPAAAQGLFGNPKAAEFMAGFIKAWGRQPELGAADNFSGVLGELVAAPGHTP
jgi:hypothetical protein